MSASSSRLTPKIVRPCGAYCFCSSTSNGNSSRQGSHQVAQNVTTSGLPRYFARTWLYPVTSMSGKSVAAGLEDFGAALAEAVCAGLECETPATTSTSIAAKSSRNDCDRLSCLVFTSNILAG